MTPASRPNCRPTSCRFPRHTFRHCACKICQREGARGMRECHEQPPYPQECRAASQAIEHSLNFDHGRLSQLRGGAIRSGGGISRVASSSGSWDHRRVRRSCPVNREGRLRPPTREDVVHPAATRRRQTSRFPHRSSSSSSSGGHTTNTNTSSARRPRRRQQLTVQQLDPAQPPSECAPTSWMPAGTRTRPPGTPPAESAHTRMPSSHSLTGTTRPPSSSSSVIMRPPAAGFEPTTTNPLEERPHSSRHRACAFSNCFVADWSSTKTGMINVTGHAHTHTHTHTHTHLITADEQVPHAAAVHEQTEVGRRVNNGDGLGGPRMLQSAPSQDA